MSSWDGTTDDLATLTSANATVAQLLAEMREGHHNGAPLREQIPRIMAIAEQYDLIGMHSVAADFRRHADALVPLRNIEDWRADEEAKRAAKIVAAKERRRRILTLGLARRAST